MKKVISSILVVCYILALVPAVMVAVSTKKGTTGDCTWTLTGTVLTISGNGKMGDYGGGRSVPWNDKIDKITNVKIKDGVTSIGHGAFCDHKNLSSVTIPNSITSIGAEAFYRTPFLNNKGNWKDRILYIDDYLIQAQDTIRGTCTVKPGTKVIACSAFSNCEHLSEVIIPSSVISIGHLAFFYCTGLTKITIPDSVTSIGDRAFENCKSLVSVTIPNSVTSIGNEAFAYCESLNHITLPDCLTDIGWWAFSDTAYYNDEKNWEKRCEGDVLYLGNYLIKADTMASTYTVKNGTKTIASWAFRCCSELQSITIPDSVTSIGDRAFQYCTNLSEIVVPNSITHIGGQAFAFTAYANDGINWDENILYLGSYLIEINYSDSDVYNIKNGTKVIADYAFYGCEKQSSITIPSSVIHIGIKNDVITKQTHNIDDYSQFIPLIALVGLGVGAAVFLIIRKSVKKHKSDELR